MWQAVYLILAEELTQQHDIQEGVAMKITSTYLKLFRQCPDNASYSLDTWRTILWKKALGETYSYLAEQIYKRWLYLRYKHLALATDIIVMVKQLRKKYFLALITNGPSNAQWEKIKKLSLEQYFDIILVSGDLPWEKPEANIFQKACQLLNIQPNNCVMVGDKLETDILGGIKAGLGATIWISTVDTPCLSSENPRPDFIIKQITDLSNVLTPITVGMQNGGGVVDI